MNKFSLFLLGTFSLSLFAFSYTDVTKESSEKRTDIRQFKQNISGNNANKDPFQRCWSYVSETAAVIYWQLNDISSSATSLSPGKLVDTTQNWEKDRWRFYYVKYNSDLPPTKITGNDAHTLYADFKNTTTKEYNIYMKWIYVPPTPLNIACYDPNGTNEIYNNTFTGIAYYKKTRHGDYGDTCEWATAIMFIWMKYGPADPGKYSAFVHNNKFFSNDFFLNTGTKVNMTIRIENNTFTLLKKLFATNRTNRIRGVGTVFEKQVRHSNNIFNE